MIYGYRGNQLVSLSEQVRTSQAGDVYLPGNTASGMYEYDSNGNLTKDSRKGLEYKYNRLNLLEEVWKDGEMKAQYNYLADGTKLGVRDGSGKIGYDYVGSVVYKVVDGQREFDRAIVGDVHFTSDGIRYALTDQLGSIRALIDEKGNIVQQNDYYPFGAKIACDGYANADDNRFLFSGKESQKLLDLNAYDFGARMYDASLGRWNSVDPQGFRKAKINNYIYCKNNPIIFFDPDGQDDWYVNSEGYMTRKPNTSHDAFYMINDKGNVMDNNVIFDYGTIKEAFSITSGYGKILSYISLENDELGKSLFEFFADNTTVEWQLIQYGLPGLQGQNIIGTSHSANSSGAGQHTQDILLKNERMIRSLIHNHPSGLNAPSLRDIKMAQSLTETIKRLGLNIPLFYIYVSDIGYTLYNANSVLSDFDPTKLLDSIIVKP